MFQNKLGKAGVAHKKLGIKVHWWTTDVDLRANLRP